MPIKTVANWTDIDLEHHPFFEYGASLNQIIQPLIQFFSLDSFNYHKTYHDDSYVCLTNVPEWRRYYFKERLYRQSIFELPAHNYSKHKIISSNLDTHRCILKAADKFGIRSVITFVEPRDDGCEFYFLSSSNPSQEILHNALTNLDLLDKFVANFHERAQDILAAVESERIIVNDRKNNCLSFNMARSIDKFSFLSSIYAYQFTKRELDCVPLLLKGLSAKQIAESLGISFRTVEMYINNLKQKTKSSSKSQLLLLLSEKYL